MDRQTRLERERAEQEGSAATPTRNQEATPAATHSDTPTSSRWGGGAEPESGGRCVSVYRESLFLTLVALGQDNIDLTAFDRWVVGRGGHRNLQIGRMLDINLISEPPHAPSPLIYVSKVWESVWPEGQEAIHS
jgi:hypothetical protein